ncbi:hypothetical protein CO058_01605 [candidate division WWE3 bacterium CG_4_9_14_0_2_um_filter_35_11]|uniref:Peptidoglycan bridge formation protein FemAB n=1 Tax=candidate division WWE3 bacterium CG_4_9_14_0_2_um_filter_35_11 TaxID=1975077 RepID=A0A2M8EM32_UNCKA|nr:MAG: hypothetical protein COV25_04125 [candidate division WWE3 bacterium CG10_big_fil_rev_8_21_14_0_10_35_32]PJC23788.1 MAG: hypothetical protein CO058_01605 [candidate division WWE3 bacterium CG_4_9_14_0_2_um_filter_35_11]
MISNLKNHIVQSDVWGLFKRQMGTPVVKVGEIQFTKHKIPGTPFYVGYAPKVNFFEQKFSWIELKKIAKSEKCAFIRFDVPNVLQDSSENSPSQRLISELNSKCKKSPRRTFTKWNVLLDLSVPEDVLQSNMSQKTRYNSRLAAKKGVIVKIENTEKGIKIFQDLHAQTAKRQCFLPHSREYYTKAFNTLFENKMANILVAYYEDEPVASWMIFNYDGTLYYPFGGSGNDNRNLMASNLMAWEAIKLGKSLDCKLFDMWGATSDKLHPYWGFTKFKLGYGGDLVEYIDSYDFVINFPIYFLFNTLYGGFWKLRDFMSGFINKGK